MLDERTVAEADLPPPAPAHADAALFLDFDGTLIELADRPDRVVVPALLATLLPRLAARLGGRVAIVSGRSIAQIDALLGSTALGLAVAGSHGAERRLPGGDHLRPADADRLAAAAARIEAFAAAHDGVVFEGKSCGAGLHYRGAPAHGPAADAFAERIAAEHELVHQRGKMMAEVRLPGDKGAAVTALMTAVPFAGAVPLFVGDDVTDEDGFVAAAALGGGGVLVGEARATAARWRLDDVPAVLAWLETTS